MSTDTEIGRVANALHATLNDQNLAELDTERIRQIAVEATGGEVDWTVQVYEQDSRPTAHLHDDAGQRTLSVRLEEDGTWSVTRDIPPVDDVAIPQPPPSDS
jgi:hypothetical protein